MERRKLTRVPMDLRVEDRTTTVRTIRMATDISLDGMRMATTRRYPTGKSLELDVRLRDQAHPLRVRGEVVGAGDGEVSVRFVGLSTSDRVRIVECMYGDA